MPPVSELLDILITAVLPSAGTALIVFLAVAKIAPRRFAIAAGACALASGFLAGNSFRGAAEFQIDSERVLTPGELANAFVDTFVPSTDEDAPLPPPSRYWLPWSAGLAMLGGVLLWKTRPFVGWPGRILLSGLAASLAIPPELRSDLIWSVPALTAVIFGIWFVLERLALLDEERAQLAPPLAGTVAFLGASIVLLHAHSARFVDIATIIAAALAAIAVGAWFMKANPGSVAPGIAVALPCLMLTGHQDTFSAVPVSSFALAGAGPLALAPLLLPKVRRLRLSRYWIVGAVLIAVPVAAAVSLAVMNETLSFE